MQVGSFLISKSRAGLPVAVATGRVVSKKTTQVYFEKWYVTVQACAKGSGKLVTLTLEGDFKFENDYIAKGGNIASDLGDMLCILQKRQDGKGI